MSNCIDCYYWRFKKPFNPIIFPKHTDKAYMYCSYGELLDAKNKEKLIKWETKGIPTQKGGLLTHRAQHIESLQGHKCFVSVRG